MKRFLLTLIFLLLVGIAFATTAQLDAAGNSVKVEERAVADLGSGSATTLYIEWGNLADSPGLSFYAFDGFVDPEGSSISLVDVRGFDTGGDYKEGRADSVTVDGPDFITWRSSTNGKVDGITVRIESNGSDTVHLKLGDWYGEFKIKDGKLVKNSLRRSVAAWTP